MPRPPTVLQLLPALVAGGVERGTIEMAEALVGAGFRALVASAGGPLVPALEAVGARHITLPLGAKSPIAIAGNARALRRLVSEEGVDILHARSRAPAWAGFLGHGSARFVTTYHGAYNETFPGKRLYNSVMARGERVIAISAYIRDLILARHGTDPACIRLIPRGVDAARFDPARTRPERFGLPPEVPLLLLPARLTRWKGQAVALQALSLLPAPITLVLAGGDVSGPFAQELRAQAAALGLADRLILAGHLPDLAPALVAADLVLHTSTDPEAFGRTIIEAQAMARIVLASDLGAPRETVEQGVTGWRVKPGDPAALAAAITAGLALPAPTRVVMGAAARQAVLSRYTTAAMQSATLDVYRELLV